jgi:hypothetical protein
MEFFKTFLKWIAAIFSSFCIVFVIFLLLPNFSTDNGRARLSSVKANMHTIQTIAETYAVDYGGVYAPTLEALYKEANKPANKSQPYWKDFKNPFSGQTGANQAWMALPPANPIDNATGKGTDIVPGAVIYDPVINDGTITKYYIYGGEKTADTVILDKGQAFYLTNQ